MRHCYAVGASQSSLTGGHASEASSSAAEGTWHGQVDVHVAQRLQRSRFAEQLEREPDLDASEASLHEAEAAANALAEAARQALAASSKLGGAGDRMGHNLPFVYLHAGLLLVTFSLIPMQFLSSWRRQIN